MRSAASALIIKDNIKDKKIFMIKRSADSKEFPHHWGCPGGKKEEDETPEQTAIREIKEEVNLDFKPTKLFGIFKYKDRTIYRFLGEYSGEVKLQEEEIADYAWYTYEEAIKLDLAFDYRNVLEKLPPRRIYLGYI